MTQHGALSIVAYISPGMKQKVVDLCKEIEDNDVETNPVVPFKKITSIHFARFLVLNENTDASGNPVGARLVFTTNYDLPYKDHLNQLVTFAGKGLWQMFSYCEGFSANAGYSDERLIQYMNSVMIKAETFYVGVGYRSVEQIRQENELRHEIECFADKQQAEFRNKSKQFIREKIIEFVNQNPSLTWAKTPVPKPPVSWQLSRMAKFALMILVLLILSPLIIPFVIIWLLLILMQEMKEKDISYKIDKNHIRELVNRETRVVQAQFSAVGNIKPGAVRLTTMLFLLRMTNFLAPYIYSKGKLSGIPTVHFARWLIVNNGKQMIFLSNFDGNSESYLRDFINIAGKQLSLMFCHTVGYPRTRLMVFGGADDADGFMRWARKFQTITNVWYSANKNVSVKNIFANSKLRDGLYGSMSEEEAGKWVSLI